jgi:hypothetical protein
MIPRELTSAELVDFTTAAATGVANGKVTGFLAAQNTTYSDALTDANAQLAAADLALMEAKAAVGEAAGIAEEKRLAVLKILSELKFAMKGVDAPAVDYEALNFDPPATGRSVVMPQTPTKLAATGYSNRVNALTWVGNNANGSVTYVIEAKIGDTSPFAIVGTATKQSFRHLNVTPGEYYEYRVRAQAARGLTSEWSNEAVVYGIGPA